MRVRKLRRRKLRRRRVSSSLAAVVVVAVLIIKTGDASTKPDAAAGTVGDSYGECQ